MTASNIFGRQVVEVLTNKSGGGVIAGDVVVIDTTNNDAFTTDTAGAFTGMVGIAQDTIASNAQGRVLTAGYAALVNVNASVTRGHFGKTYTVAKQATDAGASRIVGVFCQFLTGGTTPDAHIFGITDGSTGGAGSPGTPALTLSTTNSTGSAATLVATDATIAAFDATVPAAIGAAATGSAGKAARRDHVHPVTEAHAAGTADQTLAADTITDITSCSVSLAAGTWIIWGFAHCSAATSYALIVIADGSNTALAEAKDYGAASLSVGPIVVTPGSTTTYKLRAQGGGSNTWKYQVDTLGSSEYITAIKVA